MAGPTTKRGAAGAEQEPGAAIDEKQLEEALAHMEARRYEEASKMLKDMLKRHPKEAMLMHNLGVVLAEQGLFAEAEAVFLQAYDTQKSEDQVNLATMYGLATALTEQGDTPKLMQAEALFHDILEKSIAQEDKGALDTFRALDGLAKNLERQKRWMEAAEARRSVLRMGSGMFGEDSEQAQQLQAVLARAERLSRMQWYLRTILWTVTIGAPVVMGVAWNRSGMPAPWAALLGPLLGGNSTAS